MEKKLIVRGVLAGAIAGLLAFAFARIFAEPVITQAISYESGRDAVIAALDKAAGLAAPDAGPDIFSRTIQANVGIGVGMIAFGAAMGALFAVAYALYLGRVGGVRARTLALLVAGGGFVAMYLVPFIKYPANPPSIGHPETIRQRGELYLVMVVASVVLLVLAVWLGQRLKVRFGTWNAALLAAAAFAVLIGAVMAILPELGQLAVNQHLYGIQATESPLPLKNAKGVIVYPGFPADVLFNFRLYSIAAQLVLWGAIGLIFAPLADRLLAPEPSPGRAARPGSPPECDPPIPRQPAGARLLADLAALGPYFAVDVHRPGSPLRPPWQPLGRAGRLTGRAGRPDRRGPRAARGGRRAPGRRRRVPGGRLDRAARAVRPAAVPGPRRRRGRPGAPRRYGPGPVGPGPRRPVPAVPAGHRPRGQRGKDQRRSGPGRDRRTAGRCHHPDRPGRSGDGGLPAGAVGQRRLRRQRRRHHDRGGPSLDLTESPAAEAAAAMLRYQPLVAGTYQGQPLEQPSAAVTAASSTACRPNGPLTAATASWASRPAAFQDVPVTSDPCPPASGPAPRIRRGCPSYVTPGARRGVTPSA